MTRVVCGAGCVLLLTASVASIAVALVRQHHRQQRIIKAAALVQLTAGKYKILAVVLSTVNAVNDDVINDER